MGGPGLITVFAEVDDLLAELNRRGVRLALRRHRIAASPAGAVREDERALIVAHRPAVRQVLAAADPEVAWRVEAMRAQVPPFSRIIPILQVRTDTAPGTCLSCGVPAADARCEPCIAAMHVVLDGWTGD